MERGRSIYNITINCDVNLVNQLVQDYMKSNSFIMETKKGETYYKSGDAIIGYRYFNYSIANNVLTISAWLRGTFGEFKIEQKLSMPCMNYRNSLNILFQELEKVNNVNSTMINSNVEDYDSQVNNNVQQNVNTDITQTFQNETTKKQEMFCEIGFWGSLFGLLASFVGEPYGLLLYIMIFTCASQGLKTKKRSKAIATIVITIVSILILVFQIVSI